MTESRVFKLMNGVNAEILCAALEGYLRERYQMNVQSGKTIGGYIVKGRQDPDFWKKISGMELSADVQFFESGDVLNVTISQPKMSDKLGAAIIAWFFFWPLMITAAVGVKNSKNLVTDLFDYIERYILSGGQSGHIGLTSGRMISASEILCKKCNAPNTKGSKFCKNCGANLVVKCTNCGADIEDADKFCPECGVSVTIQ